MRFILPLLVWPAAYALLWIVMRWSPGPEHGLHADPYRTHRTRLALMVVPIPLTILAGGVLAGAGRPGRASWLTVTAMAAFMAIFLFLAWWALSARPQYRVADVDGVPQVTLVRWRRLLMTGLATTLYFVPGVAGWARGWKLPESVALIVGSGLIGGLIYRGTTFRIFVTARGLERRGWLSRRRTIEWRSVAGFDNVEVMGNRRFLVSVHGGKPLWLWTRLDGFPAFAAALLDHLHDLGKVSKDTREALEVYARLVPRSMARTPCPRTKARGEAAVVENLRRP